MSFLKKTFSNSWLVAFIFTSLAAIFANIILTPFYSSNDDVVMRMIAEGRLSEFFGPNEKLIFISQLYGYILKFLYSHFPNIYWYDLIFFLLMFITCIIILRISYAMTQIFLQKIIASILIFLIFIIYFSTYQFTIIAGLTFCTAFSLIIYFSSPYYKHQKNLPILAAIAGFVLISGLVRYQFFPIFILFALLCSAPLFFLYLDRKRFLLGMSACLLGIIFASAAFLWDRNNYSKNDEWKYFWEFEKYRINFTDYDPLYITYPKEEVNEKLANIGWTPQEYMLLSHWIYANPEIYSLEKMKELSDAFPQTTNFKSIKLKTLMRIESIPKYFNSLLWLLLLLLFSGLMMWQRKAFLFSIYLGLCIFISFFIISVFFKFPTIWATLAIASIPISLLVLIPWKGDYNPLRNKLDLIPSITLVLIPAITVGIIYNQNKDHKILSKAAYEDIMDIKKEYKDDLIVDLGGRMHTDRWIRPFSPIFDINMLLTGWLTKTPFIRKELKERDAEKLELALCTKPIIFPAIYYIMPIIKKFIKETYGMDVAIYKVYEGRLITLYRCIDVDKPL